MTLPSSFRQAITIAKYELWKIMKSWRLVWLVVLVIAIAVLAGKGLEGSWSALDFGKNFFSGPSYFLITIAGIAFGGDIIASEFERKTGYMLFSNPLRRVTVVAGKFIACFISTLLMILIFYLAGVIFMLNNYGLVPATILGSLGLAILYGCAVLSLVLLFSSILWGTGATVLSFSTLFIIMPFLQSLLLSRVGTEPWFLLSYASAAIGAYISHPVQRVTTSLFGTTYEYPDFLVSVIVMLSYVAVSLILCSIFTKRREIR